MTNDGGYVKRYTVGEGEKEGFEKNPQSICYGGGYCVCVFDKSSQAHKQSKSSSVSIFDQTTEEKSLKKLTGA